VIWLLGVPALQ